MKRSLYKFDAYVTVVRFLNAGKGVRTFAARSVVVLLAAVVFASAAFGRSVSLTDLKGIVVDAAGAAIPGALVEAVSPSARFRTVTDAGGRFALDVPPGKYEIVVTANGFGELRKSIDTGIDRDLADLVLQPAAASAEVTVNGDGEYLVESVQSATKTFAELRDVPQSVSVIKADQIRDQMLASISDVVRYVPGVSSHQGENNRDEVIIRSNRSNADFFRDGVRDDVQYYRDLYNLSSVEAVKGPNALAFGRGGGGGVINRVTKEAGMSPIRSFTAQLGSYRNRRFTGDLDQPFGRRFAARVNGVYEDSGSFRSFVGLERVGINPTFTFLPDDNTRLTFSYEFLRDRRTADRGITSFRGRPADVPISTFYGDPANSKVHADVNIVSLSFERVFGRLILRNRLNYGDYDRGYQNYVPREANADATLVTLSAYNNSTRRRNLFNQTDVNYTLTTGSVTHTLAFGTEFGRQLTRNFRNTGYFNNTSTTIQVPFDAPQTSVPVVFRQSATDADNRLRLNLGAAYVQDQIAISRYLQVIAGVRFDYFDLNYFNNRTGEAIRRIDRVANPRFGVVVKPVTAVSLYASYSVSFLPGSGDQFSSLTTVTQQVKPEKFTNYEVGAKWDVRRGLFLTAAVYRLDRTNTRATDPNDPTRIVQTGSQRSDGFELGIVGSITPKWTMSGGYAWQNARITSATASAAAGRQVGQVPHNTFSLWNKYAVTGKLSAGLGVVYRSDSFVAFDNTVVLPGYTEADAAIFYTLSEHWRLQANIENLTNVRYFVNADSNTNISSGRPRGVRIGIVARF